MHACINQDKPVVGILSVGILFGWDFVRWEFVRWDFVLAPVDPRDVSISSACIELIFCVRSTTYSSSEPIGMVHRFIFYQHYLGEHGRLSVS